jgi:hypothetical protein
MHLKALGFDNDEIRHRVVAYCPQVTPIVSTVICLNSIQSLKISY